MTCDAAVWVGRIQRMEPTFYCALPRGHGGKHEPKVEEPEMGQNGGVKSLAAAIEAGLDYGCVLGSCNCGDCAAALATYLEAHPPDELLLASAMRKALNGMDTPPYVMVGQHVNSILVDGSWELTQEEADAVRRAAGFPVVSTDAG